MTTKTSKPRMIRSPLYRFAVDDVVYTAEGERRSDSDFITVTLHLGYPRERVIDRARILRDPNRSVGDQIMQAARDLV